MADDDKRKFEIPWATLLPLIAALAGVIAQFRPLVSARPSIPSERAIEVTAEQDVDARLWQDPLAVAQKAKSQLDSDLATKNVPASRVQRHQLEALVSLVQHSARESSGRILLLAVMLDSGPYIEQAESRLRARKAVLEGLNESGFVPSDSEHIGFVSAAGKTGAVAGFSDESTDTSFLVPWERCAVDWRQQAYPPGTSSAFVLWLPAASFSPRPLAALADLLRPFVEGIHDKIDLKLLGPATSTGLQQMVREVESWSEEPPPVHFARDQVLDGLSIISARATAPAKELLQEAASESLPQTISEQEFQEVIERSVVSRARGGLRFLRSITTDDIVLGELVDELKLRGIEAAKGDHIVLLTEWDSKYGRSLENTFEKAVGSGAASLSSYRYMHGIDGRLPGDPAKSAQETVASARGSAALTEATEGLDQSDFLRRLALQLKHQDAIWRGEGENGIRAIGLLGSDIFDKLMILRALRPEFRDAIFFTNNFDAHFERRDDWKDARNLVVVSPFGSRVPAIESAQFKQRVAPFRDNNQTSMFFGTLVATGRLDEAARQRELSHQPRRFEIGRRGSHQLQKAGEENEEREGVTDDPRWFRKWLGSRAALWLGIATATSCAMAAWISLSVVDRRLAGGGDSRARLKRVCASTPFTLVCGVPVIVFAVARYAQSDAALAEPLAFFSGISIWPSEMLRLIGLLLALHFMVKAHVGLQLNEREITRRFFPGLVISEKWHWGLGLRRWHSEHPDWLIGAPSFSARDAWCAYLRRNRFWPRFVRVAALVAMYLVFSFAVFKLFRPPVVPARGLAAFQADGIVLFPTVLAAMILTFYVVDAIRLNSNFVRILNRGMIEWEPSVSEPTGRIPPLTQEEMARYHDIFFVAQRTEAVAPLIWYPLIVLAVSFLARNSFFDHWTWPKSLILIFTLNAAWAFGSAIFLRRSAEQLRSAAISSLQWQRVKNYAIAEKRLMFDELIAEVRAVRKGAFAPLTEQPFIRAIIYPSGGIGLLAVGQRLLDIF